jgi:hypothetical protein
VITPGDTNDEQEENPSFRGVLGMATKLQVEYARKFKTGMKCADPLYPVYVDSLVEALAHTMSLTVGNPVDVPLLASMVLGQLTKRFQVYSIARFPELLPVLEEQTKKILKNDTNIGERRLAYSEYIAAQLNGIEKPCSVCPSDCEFRGQFDPGAGKLKKKAGKKDEKKRDSKAGVQDDTRSR